MATCKWCGKELPTDAVRSDAEYCPPLGDKTYSKCKGDAAYYRRAIKEGKTPKAAPANLPAVNNPTPDTLAFFMEMLAQQRLANELLTKIANQGVTVTTREVTVKEQVMTLGGNTASDADIMGGVELKKRSKDVDVNSAANARIAIIMLSCDNDVERAVKNLATSDVEYGVRVGKLPPIAMMYLGERAKLPPPVVAKSATSGNARKLAGSEVQLTEQNFDDLDGLI